MPRPNEDPNASEVRRRVDSQPVPARSAQATQILGSNASIGSEALKKRAKASQKRPQPRLQQQIQMSLTFPVDPSLTARPNRLPGWLDDLSFRVLGEERQVRRMEADGRGLGERNIQHIICS